ncbi:MAG: 1-acyl-sn-glycerol-3-phosphate acyltransferase [Bacteroidales bacterium]|nr:1-acyl-sn-glycerol-3-phosphate acyltransferase [Bacteroidales bacterium]
MPDIDYTINIEQILKKKFGEKTPKWLIRFVRKLLHEDWLNDFFKKGYSGIEFTDKVIEYLHVTLQIEGLDHVPKDGRYTVASNHALGGNDALALISIFGKHFDGNVRFLANDFLMNLRQLREYMVAVNKVGSQSRDLAFQTDEIFSGPYQILIFPSGKVARKTHGRIQETPWAKTFITKSVQYHRDIVPMHFYGKNTWRFYLVDWMGKITGINKKFPLAMIMLVDELYRAQGKTYRIVIGDPIPWQTFDRSRKPYEWAQWVKEKVIAL